MAVKTIFRFETLLRVRKVKEDAEKRVVASRLNTLSMLDERRQALEAQVKDQTSALRDALSTGRTDIDAVRWSRHWVGGLRRGILQVESQIASNRAMLAQEQAKLRDARKDTKVLERLKEKRLATEAAERERRQQREADDLNVIRHAFAMTRQRDW